MHRHFHPLHINRKNRRALLLRHNLAQSRFYLKRHQERCLKRAQQIVAEKVAFRLVRVKRAHHAYAVVKETPYLSSPMLYRPSEEEARRAARERQIPLIN